MPEDEADRLAGGDEHVRIETAGDTHAGRLRRQNEDAIFVGETVFAVADGMGGAVGGHVASATALESFAHLDRSRFGGAGDAEAAMRSAIGDANRAVWDRASREPQLDGMGTTITAVMLDGTRLHVGHVGDSRAYLLHDGRLRQLTHDHSLVQQLVDLGHLTPEEAAVHPQAAVITRALGLSTDVEIDVETVRSQPGDRLLLCSDGLTRVVADNEIIRHLAELAEPSEAVAALVGLANDRGGPDNISVVVVAFHGA